MEKICIYCGKSISGRTDKKFCGAACRNAFHNREKNESRSVRNRIMTALNVNYRILDTLIREDVGSISLLDIERLGFRPSFLTACLIKRGGHNEHGCFDISYCQSSSRIFNIHRDSLLLVRLRSGQ